MVRTSGMVRPAGNRYGLSGDGLRAGGELHDARPYQQWGATLRTTETPITLCGVVMR